MPHSALDAGLLTAAQAVEHYEVALYHTLRAWADKLEHKEADKLLDENARKSRKRRMTP